MDAEGTVAETVSELRANMELYAKQCAKWIAPYTSFVTSSMMGKSRHMKEVANQLPCVYICLRQEQRGFGYPPRSPIIADWSLKGAATILDSETIPVTEFHFCFSTFRWSAFILSTIRKLTKWIGDGRFFTSVGIDGGQVREFKYAWLWKFFAEPPSDSKLEDFWLEVEMATHSMLQDYPTGNRAHNYFQTVHMDDVRTALKQLQGCFAARGINESVPLIFIYDEARTLCQYEAYNGARIHEEHAANFHQPLPLVYVRDNTMGLPLRSFSNFRALRRALRYLSVGTIGAQVPRVFAVFTDTTSRITNFQPASWNDPSLRVPSLPEPGPGQFRPIFVFSSVDIHSRVLNPAMCISNRHDVADPDRLLKFGRAGWDSTYVQGVASPYSYLRIPNIMVNTATSKLVSTRNIQTAQDYFETQSPADFIRMIAVLAPRLSLTIGPYTSEASELIASHLAVLTRTDSEHHFLRTVYPSEPILAEASARLTYGNGWAGPLSALVHYVRGGVVEAGFKGELLTKIVCLMAMDNVLGQAVFPEDQWQFSRPVTVSEFLNHLIIPLHDHSTFSEGLKGVQFGKELQPGTLNIDDTKLRRFLDGYVFFNHFIRVEVKLSYSMLVHAWNRGAAIMCMTNTKGVDHVIPVMLDTEGDVVFGPLHGRWAEEHIQQARQHISYIVHPHQLKELRIRQGSNPSSLGNKVFGKESQ